MLQLKGDAAVWAMHRFPMSTRIEWCTFYTELKAKCILSNALDMVECELEEVSLKKEESVAEFHKRFRRLSSKLTPHQPSDATMLADAYRYKIGKGNLGVYNNVVLYIGMGDRTPTLKQRMEQLAPLDTSLDKS